MRIRMFILWLVYAMRSEKGASFAEYGLVTVLIAIVALIAVAVAGGETSETYSTIASDLDNAASDRDRSERSRSTGQSGIDHASLFLADDTHRFERLLPVGCR